MGTRVDEEGKGGGGRRKKRMRWKKIVWFRANRGQDRRGSDKDKGENGGGGEGGRECVLGGV